MDIKNARLGEKVNHSVFGVGAIKRINKKEKKILVSFEIAIEGKYEREILSSFLTSYESYGFVTQSDNKKAEESANVNKFEINDYVHHKAYGDGQIAEITNDRESLVYFKSIDNCLIIDNSQLIKIDDSIISDDEVQFENTESDFRIVPSNFNIQSSYSNESKRALKYLREHIKQSGIATVKVKTENNWQDGVVATADGGIIVFKVIPDQYPFEALCNEAIAGIIDNQYQIERKYYLNKFLESKSFFNKVDNKYKEIKFNFRYVYVLQNVSLEKINDDEKNKIAIKNKNILFKNFSSIYGFDLFSNYEETQNKKASITPDLFGPIIERVVPENSTLVSIVPKDSNKKSYSELSPEFSPITGNEREFSAICLEDEQIRMINDTKPGHYLTLANPGTGKSVLLVSKAYRIQSAKRDNHVLITCFNKNLAEHHNSFAELNGMKTSQLHIRTFHKLIIDFVNQIDGFNHIKFSELDYEDSFNIALNRFEELLVNGKIKTKFNAIFIDEVQLFEPRWIDICYKLLDKENDKDFFFEMYGDINQDVKSQKSKGKASWQNTKCIPSLKGRVKKLDKNYRNTELIANYVNCMITEFNDKLAKFDMTVNNDDACISSKTSRKGSLRTKVISTKNGDLSKISQLIEELRKKNNADYSEFAVIYPAKGYTKFYSPVWNLERDFDEKNIPYCFISGKEISGPEKKCNIFDCDGVIFSTIDSCLGLDFKYVILFGIHYWDFIHNAKTNKTEKFDTKKLLFDQNAKLAFNEIGKKIYSACSRARDGLYIIDDTNKDSPIKEILRPKTGRKYYDEC